MHLVAALPATLAAIGLLLLPGLGCWLLLAREEREALGPDEAVFFVPAVSVMVSAWLGLIFAEAGAFSLVTVGAVAAALGVAAAALRFRQIRALRWPQPGWRGWAPFTVLLALALALQTRPSEYIVGGRDPGTYVAAMGLIARTGGIIYTDPLVQSIPREDVELFYRNPDSPDFTWGRFMGFPLENPRSARVFPEFFHLFPVFGAFLFQAMGVKGALATPCIFGVLGTLACFLALRRILGMAAAAVGAGLLALNVLQVWFARYPLSEPVSQFLLWTGVLALSLWEERRARAFGIGAGFAIGLSLLVRVDSLLILLPVLLYLAVRRVRGDLTWRQAWPVLVPLVALAGHAALHACVWSKKYVISVFDRPYWRHSPVVWCLALAALLAALALAHLFGPRVGGWLRQHERALRIALVTLIVLASLYAYFVRPVLSAWAGADGNDARLALANRHWLAVLGFRRLAAHDAQSFVRLGWFVHPVGLALAVLGLARLLWRFQSRYLFVVLAALSFSSFYFYKLRVWNDYFFAGRRFLPIILPCALGFAAFALVELGRQRMWRRLLALGLGLLLALSCGRATARIVRHVDWQGMVGFAESEARKFGPNSVVIFEQHSSIHLLSLPLWALHDVSILELARWDPDPAELEHAIRTWRQAGREVYFVYTYRAEKGLCGLFLQHVRDVAFATKEWERSYAGPPERAMPQAFRYKVARVVVPEDLHVPALPALDVGGSDEFQVSGFYAQEGGGAHTYRWTGPCATLLLPALPGARSVVFVTSVGPRPTPARVDVSLAGVSVGSFVSGPEWEERRLNLPAGRPATNLLRLSVSTWRPMNVDPSSDDARDLGVMVDRVWLEPAARGGATR